MRALASVLALALVSSVLAGCIGSGADDDDPGANAVVDGSLAPVADAWYDATLEMNYLTYSARFLGGGATGAGSLQFHTYDQVLERIAQWNETYPDLVDVRTIGESRDRRPIVLVTLTDESVDDRIKPVALFDGGHHGNEYAGAEVMLYLVDLLLQNHATNRTVRDWLIDLEVQVVPVVNPDGYEAGTRHNAHGVNLNRNYDIDWGNPAGTSNPFMGMVADTLGLDASGAALVAENCGSAPFSEPESQAIRDWMASVGDRATFYLTGHTPTASVIGPWAAFEPPNEVPDEHRAVLDETLGRMGGETQYEAGYAGWGDFSGGLPYSASGSSMDFFYATYEKPTFTVEVEYFAWSPVYQGDPERLFEGYDGLNYWMQETIPIHLNLLANWEALSVWALPGTPTPRLEPGTEHLDWALLPEDPYYVH